MCLLYRFRGIENNDKSLHESEHNLLHVLTSQHSAKGAVPALKSVVKTVGASRFTASESQSRVRLCQCDNPVPVPFSRKRHTHTTTRRFVSHGVSQSCPQCLGAHLSSLPQVSCLQVAAKSTPIRFLALKADDLLRP